MTKRPHRFLVEVEHAFAGKTTYSIEHGKLKRESNAQTQGIVAPRTTDWHGFWRFCDFIELWEWKADYSPSELDMAFRDGVTWKLDIAFDKSRRISASGNNVFPSFNSAKSSATTMDRFGLLLDFIDGMLRVEEGGVVRFYGDEDLH